ncbi:unnamed protein product [Rodentolepis nana]|uniref:SERPIN domain-containing protein n=1 Tax=Rodentolepis nana TaxID=102285 RepID=A0A0R3T4S9_RODNA|nr:unnamed protein product [Rodentolepis nana]
MCGPRIVTHEDFNAGFTEASLKAYGNSGNYVASPMSVLVLMSALLTAKGPQGNTAKEICEALVGEKKKYSCINNEDYKEVVSLLEKIRTGVETARSPEGESVLKISNAAFIEKSFSVKDQFIKGFTFFHGDKVMRTLFNNSDAFENINKWADTATDGLIPKFLNSKDELSKDTLLVLLNAITFKDNWAKPFDTERTKNSDFRLTISKSIQVPMMQMEGRMIYIKEDDYKVLAKPFKNERFSFVIFLPEKDFEIDEIEDELEDGDFKWHKVTKEKYLRQVQLKLPKFKVEHKFDLKPILQLLGMRSIFTPGYANLTGKRIYPHEMSNPCINSAGINNSSALYASDARQVAMMEVDEAGVKAAAVSGLSIMPMSLPPPATPFIVNQPFYCAIYDSQLDMPLFIARIVDPRKGGNCVTSPMSVGVLLSALLYSKGPQGDTAKEICEALVGNSKKPTSPYDAVYTEVASLLEKIRQGVETAKSPEGESVLKISNAAFIEKSFSVKDQFIKGFTFFHGDKVMRTLFNNSDAFENINEWANTATDGLIPKFLNSKDEFSEDAVLVLLSAITFKGISNSAPLYAVDAKQIGMIEVDEAGVKAAAVSAFKLEAYRKSSRATPFIVDQPFYCAIYDSQLDLALFIARIVDPR